MVCLYWNQTLFSRLCCWYSSHDGRKFVAWRWNGLWCHKVHNKFRGTDSKIEIEKQTNNKMSKWACFLSLRKENRLNTCHMNARRTSWKASWSPNIVIQWPAFLLLVSETPHSIRPTHRKSN
jgi:hypothetical protein